MSIFDILDNLGEGEITEKEALKEIKALVQDEPKALLECEEEDEVYYPLTAAVDIQSIAIFSYLFGVLEIVKFDAVTIRNVLTNALEAACLSLREYINIVDSNGKNTPNYDPEKLKAMIGILRNRGAQVTGIVKGTGIDIEGIAGSPEQSQVTLFNTSVGESPQPGIIMPHRTLSVGEVPINTQSLKLPEIPPLSQGISTCSNFSTTFHSYGGSANASISSSDGEVSIPGMGFSQAIANQALNNLKDASKPQPSKLPRRRSLGDEPASIGNYTF